MLCDNPAGIPIGKHVEPAACVERQWELVFHLKHPSEVTIRESAAEMDCNMAHSVMSLSKSLKEGSALPQDVLDPLECYFPADKLSGNSIARQLSGNACSYTLQQPVLHVTLGRLHSKLCTSQQLGHGHGCPRVEGWLSTGHPGPPAGQGHKDDKLVLHPAHKQSLVGVDLPHDEYVLCQLTNRAYFAT